LNITHEQRENDERDATIMAAVPSLDRLVGDLAETAQIVVAAAKAEDVLRAAIGVHDDELAQLARRLRTCAAAVERVRRARL
jgi:hypothetical protein